MTDRDTFAAAALTGLLVNANGDIDEDTLDTPSDLAYTAYEMADAMLRERERTFDAKPRELSDDQRTLRNAADLLGPGGFKNLANELLSLSRRLADKSYAKSCKKCNSSHTGRDADDRPEPIKDAESDRPQPIATGDTPATLTDEERKAFKTVIGGFGMWVAQNGLTDDESLRLAVVTLRGLLERLK